MNSAETFVKVVNNCSYKGKGWQKMTPLTNLTFFLGAGFSKSWDSKYPTGEELFSINPWDYEDSFFELVKNMGFSDGNLELSDLKEIFYQIGMQQKYPALRMRYTDESNLKIIEKDVRAIITKRFNSLIPLNYIERGGNKLKLKPNNEEHKKNILRFFNWIKSHSTGDRVHYPEGLRINYLTTNYDFLIESIMESCLGEDDSHYIYTYRGFTPTTINSKSRLTTFHDHILVENLIKINGGFEIFENIDGTFYMDYNKQDNFSLNKNPPVLILPNREQDYTGNYFQTIFPKAIRTLQESNVLVIVGYSIPDEDALIRILLRQFAEEAIDGAKKIIFYIDLLSEKDQKEKLKGIFPYHKKLENKVNVITYSGYFSTWIEEVLHELKNAL